MSVLKGMGGRMARRFGWASRIGIGLVAGGLVVSCASGARSGPAPIVSPSTELAGRYQFETVVARSTPNGPATPERLTGTLRLEGNSSMGYSGEIDAAGQSPMPITSVDVGRRGEVTLTARDLEGGVVTLRLVFQGEAFSGQWVTTEGLASPIQGVRRD